MQLNPPTLKNRPNPTGQVEQGRFWWVGCIPLEINVPLFLFSFWKKKNWHDFIFINTHLIAFERYDKCAQWYLILKLSLRTSLIGKELLFSSATPTKEEYNKLHKQYKFRHNKKIIKNSNNKTGKKKEYTILRYVYHWIVVIFLYVQHKLSNSFRIDVKPIQSSLQNNSHHIHQVNGKMERETANYKRKINRRMSHYNRQSISY